MPLDLLLTRPVFGLADRILPNMSWRRFAINLARQPRVVASRASTLGGELVVIAAGRSDIAPAKGDKRFADPAWAGNNGIGASLEVLDPLVAQLDPDTTVVRFDVPGTGVSPDSPVPYGFP